MGIGGITAAAPPCGDQEDSHSMGSNSILRSSGQISHYAVRFCKVNVVGCERACHIYGFVCEVCE